MTATSTFPITVNVLPAGSGTASCTPNPVAEGGTTTCTVVPAGPWGVLSWAGTGTGGCAGTACTFVNVTEARTLSVTLDVPIAAEPEAQPVPALGARALLVLTWLVAGLGVALRRRQSSQ